MAEALHLVYHYVRDGDAPGHCCSPARLARQIEFLMHEGYEFLTCREVFRRTHQEIPFPSRYAVLTFDDGLADHKNVVLPILREYGIRATFFVIGCTLDGKFPPVIGLQALIDLVGLERMEQDVMPQALRGTRYFPLLELITLEWLNRVGMRQAEPPHLRVIKYVFNDLLPSSLKTDLISQMFAKCLGEGLELRVVRQWFLDREDMCAMEDMGMEIGAHSMTHPMFSALGYDDIVREVSGSLEYLGRLRSDQRSFRLGLGVENIFSFAYPFGERIRPEVARVVAHYFASAWNGLPTTSEMPQGDYPIHDIPRIIESKCGIFRGL
ncbi:MAG: polysaccharide deacetylase family protein [Candidatus Sungbacteria bacterium]|nr:polysaccharide deacetylase family protein [Candidatus Sungbacteria bacterium]